MTDSANRATTGGDDIDLKRIATQADPLYRSANAYRAALHEKTQALGALQRKLAAEEKRALLLVFEGLDASGKDGSIRRAFRYCDPQSCLVYSFDRPDAVEARHDFLWRYNRCLPRSGQLAVFNRSYVGDAVIPRVLPELIEHSPPPEPVDKSLWEGRYRSIVDWEAHLVRNGTRILKIFLHLSADEQRRRLLKRIDKPDKRWKIELDDVCNHHRFAEFLRHYEKCIARTHAPEAPWLIVPADDKRNARLIVVDRVLHELQAMRPDFPSTSGKRARQLEEMRSALLEKNASGNICRLERGQRE